MKKPASEGGQSCSAVNLDALLRDRKPRLRQASEGAAEELNPIMLEFLLLLLLFVCLPIVAGCC